MNCKKETDKIVNFIQDYFKEAGFKKAVVGISGGIDSAVICALLVRALGKENVYGFSLPYGNQIDIEDAGLVVKKYGVKYGAINIKDTVDSYTSAYVYGDSTTLRMGNIKARTRMTILYDMSTLHNGLVVGTGNKTELMLGYFTIHGDGACSCEPIGHLFKTEVKKLAKYLEVPQKVIDKAPSAGLWDGQTDEQELGGTYKEIDVCLKLLQIGLLDDDYLLKVPLAINLMKRIKKNKFKLKPPAQMGD